MHSRYLIVLLLLSSFSLPALVDAAPPPQPPNPEQTGRRTTLWPRYHGDSVMRGLPIYEGETQLVAQAYWPYSGEGEIHFYNSDGGYLGMVDIGDFGNGEIIPIPPNATEADVHCQPGDTGSITFIPSD